MRLIALLSLLAAVVHSYKYLVSSTQHAKSHVNFLARLSDTLVDAGHEVVMISAVLNSKIGGAMTEKARVIEIPQCEAAVKFDDFVNNEWTRNAWNVTSPIQMMLQSMHMIDAWGHVCGSVLTHPGLLEQLRAEKFDAGFCESFDPCGPVLFHLLGIDSWAATDSVATKDGGFFITQTPGNPAYVPALMQGSTDEMSFLERLGNAIGFATTDVFMALLTPKVEAIIRESAPGIPSLQELASTNSLVFFNSEPLVDFPKITSARIIDIGGITVSSGAQPLDKEWSAILDLRPQTVLLSFGTIAQSFGMPEAYKRTIRETFRRFPNVTFIWKYEKPEDKITEGLDNVIEHPWLPQRDLLHDPRLSAFITHCGQGSQTEAIDAGIPLIVIPILLDQTRNSYQVERIGNGLRMNKEDLETDGKLEQSIREILTNKKYRAKARKLREMIADRPFPMKEIFVRNMEFLAKHGPLRQLDHYGRHLNFFQYYLIDVIAFVCLIVLTLLSIVLLFIRAVYRCLFVRKMKKE